MIRGIPFAWAICAMRSISITLEFGLPSDSAKNALGLYRKGIQLVGRRRLAIKQAGQKLPLTPAKVTVHPADAVDDAPLPVQQQEHLSRVISPVFS